MVSGIIRDPQNTIHPILDELKDHDEFMARLLDVSDIFNRNENASTLDEYCGLLYFLKKNGAIMSSKKKLSHLKWLSVDMNLVFFAIVAAAFFFNKLHSPC